MSQMASESGSTKSGSPILGGLGFFSGLVLCGVALIAQAALLHAVTAKKTS